MVDKIKVKRKRNFSAHHILIGAARAAVEDAEQQKPGWFYNDLTAIIMSALSVEALCNSIGNRVIEGWQDYESSSPIAKLRILCKRLGITYNQNKEPWTTVKWLCKFRNIIAHAKPELVDEEYIMSREEYDKRRTDYPKSKLEKEVTLGKAKRALNAVETVKQILCEKIPAENSFGLYCDSWGGSAKAVKDD
jgi:hypothetical protein